MGQYYNGQIVNQYFNCKMKKFNKSKPARFQEIKLNSNNKYYSLLESDAFYPNNLSQKNNQEFKLALTKIAQDINFLVYMKDQEFWKELENNDSLRLSLQSCLAVFPRREYSGYSVASHPKRETIQEKEEYYKIYAHLTKVVLYVYFRISSASTIALKDMVYDKWLLDIPKLLDIAAIYGESNPEIVRNIIANAYKAHPNFDDDTLDFFQLVERHRLLATDAKTIQIDFSPEVLFSKYYGNREKYMLQQAGKEIFRVKDFLLNLTNFFIFFPQKYAFQLAADYKIQERLIRALAQFLKGCGQEWKMGKYAKQFEFNFQDIRQSIAKYFIQEFKLLKSILQSDQTDFIEAAENTYETLCLFFSEKRDQAELKYYKRMINHLIEESSEPVFFMPVEKLRNPDKRTQKSLQYCVQYETFYRKQKLLNRNQTLFDELEQKFRRSIAKWRQISNIPRSTVVALKQQQKKVQFYMKSPVQKTLQAKKTFISWEYEDEYQEKEQFARIQAYDAPIQEKEKNTSFSVQNFNQKKKVYVQKGKGKKPSDMNLSVWSQPNLEEQTSYFDDKKQLESSMIIPQPQLLNFKKSKGWKEKAQAPAQQDLQYRPASQNTQAIELSFSRAIVQDKVNSSTNKSKVQARQDLSFSLSIQPITPKENELSLSQFKNESCQPKLQDELTSLLADIDSHVNSNSDTSFSQKEIESNTMGNQQLQLPFTWDDVEPTDFQAYFLPETLEQNN